MSPPNFSAPVDAIRDALKLAVEATSLRSVAREVGMSPMGLRNFVSGRSLTSYSATVRKLNAWYVTHAATRGVFSSETSARAAIVLLLEAISEDRRPRVAADLLDWLAERHREIGVPPADWLGKLREKAASAE